METKQETARTEMPVGYRFVPNDVELVTHYLMNKVFSRPIPAGDVKDIEAIEFYSKAPSNLVEFSSGEREWYFFIHQGDNFQGKKKQIQIVGNGLGFWKPIEEEYPVSNSEGAVLAFKIYLTYFTGSPSLPKKTHWRMEEFRLPADSSTKIDTEEWVLGRLKRGKDYTSCS